MSRMESNEELVAKYLRGDERAFEQLVTQNLKQVYSFSLRLTGNASDAEDITQETFLKVWRNLKRYSSTSASFKTWLMHIARNTAIDHLRKKKAIPFSFFENEEGENAQIDFLPDDIPLPDEITAHVKDVATMESALKKIPPLHREILLLYNGNDFSFSEIASILDESVNTVKSRYRRALDALRKVLMHPKQ